jgi:hypothetical protein
MTRKNATKITLPVLLGRDLTKIEGNPLYNKVEELATQILPTKPPKKLQIEAAAALIH